MKKEKITNLIIDERLKSRNITRVSDYIDSRIKLKFKCNIDGYVWETRVDTVLGGSGCPKCSHNIKLTNNILDDILLNSNIKRIGNIVKGSDRVEFECLECGYTWIGKKQHVCNKKICPKCHRKSFTSYEKIKDRLNNFNITLIGEYINTENRISCKCNICNYIWNAQPLGVMRLLKGCPRCLKVSKLDNSILDERLKFKSIIRLDEYVNCTTKIRFQCLEAGHIWKSEPRTVLSHNRGCPLCKIGKNEKRISNLIHKFIKFESIEPHFKMIFNDRKYFPDFYLKIGNRIVIIEYNGQQHYKPVTFGGMDKDTANMNFLTQQKRDEEMRVYCKQNSIELLEIPYFWKNDKIIEEFIKMNIV